MVILHKNLSYMSDLNTRATVTLSVNGQLAEKTLQMLKQNALDLETAISKAASAGNKADLKRLRRELTSTKRQIREIESASMQVDNVLRRLDRLRRRNCHALLLLLIVSLNIWSVVLLPGMLTSRR